MWTCDIMFIWTIICIILIIFSLSFSFIHFIVKLWVFIFITVQENSELKCFEQVQSAPSSVLSAADVTLKLKYA